MQKCEEADLGYFHLSTRNLVMPIVLVAVVAASISTCINLLVQKLLEE